MPKRSVGLYHLQAIMKNILFSLIERLLSIEIEIVFDDFQLLFNSIGNTQSSYRFITLSYLYRIVFDIIISFVSY